MDNPTLFHESGTRSGKLEFLWIEDEGLLRDEGAVFGLAGDSAALEFKEAAIRAYFRRLAAESDRRRHTLSREIAALEESRDEAPAAGGNGAVVQPAPEEAGGALVARYALGMLGAALMCVGTAVFVYEQFRPLFAAAGLITVGVVAAGFFTAFLPVSLLFVGDGERRAGEVELWKVRLTELGVPLVAALFVVAWAWERLGIVRAGASAALLFVVFTFAGRQLLSSIPRLGDALRALARRRAAHDAERESLVRDAQQRARREAQAGRILTLQRELDMVPSAEEWVAACEAKVALFRSEYELALSRAAHPSRLVEPIVFSTNGST